MTPLRLLHVVPSYLPAWRHGGPIVSVHGLCRALAERGHEVTVFTTDIDGPGRLDVPLGRPVDRNGVGVHYFPVGPTPLHGRLHLSRPLARALREETGRFDLAHLHSLFLPPVSSAASAAHAHGVPYALAPRGMLVRRLLARRGRRRKALWMRLRGRRAIRRAAFLHATSEREAADARELGLILPPIEVIPNGVELPEDGAATEPSPEIAATIAAGPYLLALGRIDWKKGLDRAISALAELPGVRLVVAGPDDGDRERLEGLAGAAGVAHRIAWTGPVYGGDKAALYRATEALVLPSHHENFGNVVLEAMAAGRPVVVTPEVGVAARVEEARAGVVTPGEPAALAAALRGLLADPEAARAMGRRGREVAEGYAWPRIAERMEEVYRRAIERAVVPARAEPDGEREA